MLQAFLIGNVGADAQLQAKDGRKFTTFRVAHNDVWTGQAGQEHRTSIWVDCVMNDHPKVAEYIKAGTQVCVWGTITLRVYSSAKDRCMKAGMQINVRSIELLGGRNDDVPTRLYDNQGVQHDVSKWYLTDVKSTTLMSQRGAQFSVDGNGWVKPLAPTVVSGSATDTNGSSDAAAADNSNDPNPASNEPQVF